jgi:predicted membrane protein
MRKAVIIASFATLGIIILVKSGIFDAFVLFFLVGVVPGTDYSVPSSVMLLAIGGIIWLIILRLTAIEVFYSFSLKRSVKHYEERKKRLPKRRFGRI